MELKPREVLERIIDISYMDHIVLGERVRAMRDNAKMLLDSLTPSHDAQEPKDGHLKVSQIQLDTPLDVVVEAPHNHAKQLND